MLHLPRSRFLLSLVVAVGSLLGPTSCRSGKTGAGPDGPVGSDPASPAAAGEEASRPTNPEEKAALAQLDQMLPEELPTLEGGGISEELPGFDPGGAPAAGGNDGPWMRSAHEAIARAQMLEKPIVFWISDSRTATDNLLANEVGPSNELRKALQSKSVPLKVDYGQEMVRRSPYYDSLRDRFRPRGSPTVLVLQPDGTETARYTGYSKGTAEGWVQRLDRDLDRTAEVWQAHKRELGKSGFRTWTDRAGHSFFGKAISRDHEAVLIINPFRRRFRIPLDRFSNESLTDLLDAVPGPPPAGL